jgi:transcriptional regulator GlxA family with amidase domain
MRRISVIRNERIVPLLPGHFSRVFKRYVGVSPTEWKRQS